LFDVSWVPPPPTHFLRAEVGQELINMQMLGRRWLSAHSSAT
jgi:hypothetical protein